MVQLRPRSTLFPYTTLFRSAARLACQRLRCARLGSRPAAQAADALDRLSPAVAAYTGAGPDRKSTRLNSSHTVISYAAFCLKKKKHGAINPQNAATPMNRDA